MEELAEELDPLWFSKCYSQEMPTFGGGTEENLSPVVLRLIIRKTGFRSSLAKTSPPTKFLSSDDRS